MTPTPSLPKLARPSLWAAITPFLAKAWVFRRRLLLIALLALLGTTTQLVEPLIYRAAVNDLAGVFVDAGGDLQSPAEAAPGDEAPDYHQPHHPGLVSPRRMDQAVHTLVWAVVLLFLLAMISQAFDLAADNVANLVANLVERRFILAVFSHLLRLPLSFFATRSAGALAKRVDQSDRVTPILLTVSKNLLPEAILVLGILAIMFFQSWRLAMVALVTLPLYLWVSKRSAAALEGRLDEYYEMWEAVSAQIHETLGAVKTVKLSGAEQRETGRLGASIRESYHSYHDRQRIGNRFAFWERAVTQGGKALVLLVGGMEVFRHQLTPGDVVMFVVYLEMLYEPVESLSAHGLVLQQNASSLAKSLKVLEVPQERKTGSALPPGPGKVEARGLGFSYLPGRPVLKGVDFIIQPGAMTALVGPSGAGKSTLADLLLRFYEPESGSLMLDGADLKSVDASALRREVGVVAADGMVFHASLAENIRYKRADASDEEVLQAAKDAGLEKLLARLPQGLDTEVGDSGVGLSLGERQRLQIARVLVSKPRLLILDEATANLDYAMEAQVKTAIAKLRGKCTLLIIAHRWSMVQDCDHALVLDQGRIIQQGTPAELAIQPGWFAAMARAGKDQAPAP